MNDEQRLAIAKQKHPRCKNWYGVRGSGTVRKYVCYCCDAVIDTESARYRMTQHAIESIVQHEAECPALREDTLPSDTTGLCHECGEPVDVDDDHYCLRCKSKHNPQNLGCFL